MQVHPESSKEFVKMLTVNGGGDLWRGERRKDLTKMKDFCTAKETEAPEREQSLPVIHQQRISVQNTQRTQNTKHWGENQPN